MNMHLHKHLSDCIREVGPVYFWCFAYERMNGVQQSTWIILYKQQAYFSTIDEIDEQVSLKQNVRFDKLAPGIPC